MVDVSLEVSMVDDARLSLWRELIITRYTEEAAQSWKNAVFRAG